LPTFIYSSRIGTLEWDSAGFFDTAVNVNLVEFGRRLEAVLVRESGMEDICRLWLDERISNINGELVYRKQISP
jgi:hypothetical protein